MDEASVLQTVEDAVLNHGDHDVLCQAIHSEPATHMVTIARGSECIAFLSPYLSEAEPVAIACICDV